ncbi:MAG TPA: KUP/HAK/KT family potassium transporter, partial [Thermoanaerobaculia bacterium]|nr:KUP/HAK/KT family potassium transporter [Thermoanaerobaculia bacterium]
MADQPSIHAHAAPELPRGRYLLTLSIASLGIVYGDIGTSPLYALEECFAPEHGIAPVAANVLGILSLIFWALIIVISIKYIVFVMRADNQGEGGIVALMSLIDPRAGSRRRKMLLAIGLFGAALLYGDGIITPAISVLSAVEGLEVATPAFEPYVVPITIAVIIGLFSVQKRGTAGIGAIFGPVTLLWFTTIAVLGARQVIAHPAVLGAVNPVHAARFFASNGTGGFFVLGAVFLVVTGGEALYADMGHFGPRPIRAAWFAVVLPSLLLNYFGQGALILSDPHAIDNPFYHLAPSWLVYPLVVLATMATVIASQALISGAFSLTSEAMQIGLTPRLSVEHTSERQIGQIYIPGVNWALMLACIGVVLGFRSATNLASAYGVAVTTTMVITTLLFYVVMRERWNWSLPVSATVAGAFLIVDSAFFTANIVKIDDGGWFPLLVGALIFTLMSTWRRGREILDARLKAESLPLELFLSSVASSPMTRVSGTAVFLHRNPEGTPTALLHSIKHYKVLHETVVLLT